MFKYTKKKVTLAQIAGIPLQYHAGNGTKYRIRWDNTEGKMMADATLESNTWKWKDLATPLDISTTFSQYTRNLYFWSRSLGGTGQIQLAITDKGVLMNPPFNSTSVANFQSRELVFPGDKVPSTLRCYHHCISADNLTKTDPYVGGKYNYVSASAQSRSTDYTFSTSANGTNPMALIGKNVQQEDIPLVVASKRHLSTGYLFDPNGSLANGTTNLQALVCQWDSSKICPWNIHDLDEFYMWEAGFRNWDKFTTLKDKQGQFLRFDQPMQIKYVHSQTNSTYDGKQFYLEYAGFGRGLEGIPTTCFDANTGKKASCHQSGAEIRFLPEFTIPKGAEVVDGKDDSIKYVVKPLGIEQTMSKVENTICDNAGLSLKTLTFQSINSWKNPNLPEVENC